jgi:hypothetical protein
VRRAERARALVLSALVAACAGALPVPTRTTEPSPAWFDVAIDRSTSTVAVVDLASPRLDARLRRAIVDALLSVFDRALGPGAELHRAVEASSEMTIVANPAGDPLVVLRDVAPLDPTTLPGADGAAQFALGDVGEVVEYIYRPAAGSLFVLRDRTWVIGAGTAAQTVKNAFAGRGAPVLPPRAPSPNLATLWMPGPALRAVARREKAKLLAPVLVRATALDAALGEDDVAVAHFRYATEDDAKEAHATLVDVARAFARRNDPPTAWLGQAQLVRDAFTVTLRMAVPPDAFASFEDAH